MMRLGKTQSILPNSSAAILRPMANGLQVVWNEDQDQHVLTRNGEPIAAHHNGFSCHELAVRMLSGNMERALAQFDYIKSCGGKQYVSRDELESLIS